jgi:hypothetical protein
MKRLPYLIIVLTALAFTCASQTKTTPWTEWSKKDAEKILNDSAWGQTQTIGGGEATTTSAITRTQGGGNENVSRTGESGETMGGPKPVYYRARFLTAKPIREAFARLVVLSQPNAGKDLVDQLQGFIDRDFGSYLVVAVNVESPDEKRAAGMIGAFGRLNKDVLKEKVYLERKDGKRLALLDYKPPINDNLGAKFVFERTLDGQPFLTSDSDFVKFVVEISERLKLNLRFRVAAMTYGDKLEY